GSTHVPDARREVDAGGVAESYRDACTATAEQIVPVERASNARGGDQLAAARVVVPRDHRIVGRPAESVERAAKIGRAHIDTVVVGSDDYRLRPGRRSEHGDDGRNCERLDEAKPVTSHRVSHRGGPLSG